MRARNGWLIALCAAGFVAFATGCGTNSNVDDPDTGDVVLEVATTTSAPVTTAGGAGAPCTFTVTEWTSTLNNKPKNPSAIVSPFDDILMGTVTVSYVWDDLAIVTPTRVFNVSGTIPANGSAAVKYPPILLGDLDTVTMPGHSAILTLVFDGVTVAGDAVQATGVGAVLTVNSCPP